jgi:hypothetical protein
MAYVIPVLAAAPSVKIAIAALFVISGYAFIVSTPLAAVTRDRGLAPGATGLARVVYWGNIIGALTSLLAAALLLAAAAYTLLVDYL